MKGAQDESPKPGTVVEKSCVGTFENWNKTNSCGFIKRDGGGADVFAFKSDLQGVDIGGKVSFDVITQADGKVRATKVQLVKEPKLTKASVGEKRVCTQCNKSVDKSGYSAAQWTKAVTISRCKECVAEQQQAAKIRTFAKSNFKREYD